jgi:hypothetical protein
MRSRARSPQQVLPAQHHKQLIIILLWVETSTTHLWWRHFRG